MLQDVGVSRARKCCGATRRRILSSRERRTDCPRATEANILTGLRYYWRIAKGYRLRPWRSPYIRWRMETFYGGDMHDLGAGDFFSRMWQDRAAMRAFLRWVAQRESALAQHGKEDRAPAEK